MNIFTSKNIVKETPLQFDHYLSQKYNCNVYLKEKIYSGYDSFKLRGAYNAISVLSMKKNKGITCASVEIMLKVLLILPKTQFKAVIFMPVTTPRQKSIKSNSSGIVT